MQVKSLFAAMVLSVFSYTGCAVATESDELVGVTEDELAMGKANVEGFKDIPTMTDAQRQAILDKYAAIDHAGVRQALYETAILYYDTNYERIPNKRWLSVLDFSKHSGKRRFFELDMDGGPVQPHKVAHGQKSDADDDGVATVFSNTVDSWQSSVGFYLTAETYDGTHGESLKLDGLSPTNSKVRERYIVVHSATYVEDSKTKQGRSQGCIVFSESEKPGVVMRLKQGSIIYAMN
jgi:hypothetical protein